MYEKILSLLDLLMITLDYFVTVGGGAGVGDCGGAGGGADGGAGNGAGGGARGGARSGRGGVGGGAGGGAGGAAGGGAWGWLQSAIDKKTTRVFSCPARDRTGRDVPSVGRLSCRYPLVKDALIRYSDEILATFR